MFVAPFGPDSAVELFLRKDCFGRTVYSNSNARMTVALWWYP